MNSAIKALDLLLDMSKIENKVIKNAIELSKQMLESNRELNDTEKELIVSCHELSKFIKKEKKDIFKFKEGYFK